MKSKVLVLVVVCTFIASSANLMAKERRGAELVVQQLDGKQVKGELIAVKTNSLLLLDSRTRADMSFDIKEVSTIRIVHKSKALLGAGLGFLGGMSITLLYTRESSESGTPFFCWVVSSVQYLVYSWVSWRVMIIRFRLKEGFLLQSSALWRTCGPKPGSRIFSNFRRS